jgi:hypothetical protein
MKELVIKVVSFFSWLGVITFVLFGYGWGVSANHQILGPIAGFLIGCCVSGLWFLLVSMHEKLAIIAGALTARREMVPEPPILARGEVMPEPVINPKGEAGKNSSNWLYEFLNSNRR